MTKNKHEHNNNEDQPPEEGPGAKNNDAGQPVEQAPMVAMTMEEYDELQTGLEKAQNEAKEYLDGWQRERAEMANYRRRVERDQALATANITGQVIKKYLVILDDLERALKSRPSDGEGAGWSAGVELIARKLQTILDTEGVQRISGDGQFDPNLHEALTHEEAPEFKSGEIIEIVQQGYKIGDRVLRPALVRVAR